MEGFEQEALRELHDSMHHQKPGMAPELNRTSRGGPYVLHHLLRHGTSTPSGLAAALHASSGRISALLGTLEKKGLVTRRIDPDDRRNILVSLTGDGRRQAKVDHSEISSAVCWVFSQMGERRTREFVDLADEFMTYLSVCKPGEPRPSADAVKAAFEERDRHREAGLADVRPGARDRAANGTGGSDGSTR